MKRFIFIIGLALLQCLPIQVENIELCDLWDDKGICQEPWENNEKIYKIPKDKSFATWENLSHYLYFRSRETPGILLHWNRNLNQEELDYFKRECKAHFSTELVSGKMEGKEIREDFIGFFHYFGSIVEKEKKSQNLWNSPIDWESEKEWKVSLRMDCGTVQLQKDAIIRIVRN